MKKIPLAYVFFAAFVAAAIAEWLVFHSPRLAIATLVLAAVSALGRALWQTFRV